MFENHLQVFLLRHQIRVNKQATKGVWVPPQSGTHTSGLGSGLDLGVRSPSWSGNRLQKQTTSCKTHLLKSKATLGFCRGQGGPHHLEDAGGDAYAASTSLGPAPPRCPLATRGPETELPSHRGGNKKEALYAVGTSLGVAPASNNERRTPRAACSCHSHPVAVDEELPGHLRLPSAPGAGHGPVPLLGDVRRVQAAHRRVLPVTPEPERFLGLEQGDDGRAPNPPPTSPGALGANAFPKVQLSQGKVGADSGFLGPRRAGLGSTRCHQLPSRGPAPATGPCPPCVHVHVCVSVCMGVRECRGAEGC